MAVLALKDIRKVYERGGRPFEALKGVSLEVEAGKLTTIFGRSGSGKSTMLNVALGLLKPDGGVVTLSGKNLDTLSDEEKSLIRNREIGYIPQGIGVLSTLTVKENVRLPWYLSKREDEPENRAQELLEKVGLAELGNQYPSALSGGELRRVAVARSMMTDPAIIVADEPTSSLDEATAKEIMDVLVQLAQSGKALLVVTHDEAFKEVSDVVYEMKQGELERTR